MGTPRSLPHTADGSGPASGVEVWWWGGGGGVPEHQPWFCCWLRKSRSLAPRQQEESRVPTRQPDSRRPTQRGRRPPSSVSHKAGTEVTKSKLPEPGRGQNASEAKATNNKIH